MTSKFKVPTPLKTAMLADAHAQRMAEDTEQALRNAGIKSFVEVALEDTKAGVVANIEVHAGDGIKKSDVKKVIDIMYG